MTHCRTPRLAALTLLLQATATVASPQVPSLQGKVYFGTEQTSGRTVPYQRTADGLAIVHGDIIAGTDQAIRSDGIPLQGLTRPPGKTQRGKRSTWQTATRLWPDNRVFYSLERANPLARQALQQAITEIEANSAVRFSLRGQQAHYLDIVSAPPDGGCYSYLGYLANGGQRLQLPDWCAQDPASVLHEILHALGFSHEQQRPDRDQYVRINPAVFFNSDGSRAASSLTYDLIPHLDTSTPYDLDSVMHYYGIQPRPPYRINPSLGRSAGKLSPGDIRALALRYPPRAKDTVAKDNSNKRPPDPCKLPRLDYRQQQRYAEGDVVSVEGTLYQLKNGEWSLLQGCDSTSVRHGSRAQFSQQSLSLSASARYATTLWITSGKYRIESMQMLERKGVGGFGHEDERAAKNRWEITLWPVEGFRGTGGLKVKIVFQDGHSEIISLPVTVTD